MFRVTENHTANFYDLLNSVAVVFGGHLSARFRLSGIERN
jgi:hypothetical protein